ncbi:hypothetical protein ABEB36_009078 [Hypothenemus hampei]|uniref:Glucose-methanol-choline oxidoreductase N-terminal domain-containing protein n=1 Tax=Hypothenemus hampei TaxID=57062 RepID=A0ABD1EP13_HYPHA
MYLATSSLMLDILFLFIIFGKASSQYFYNNPQFDNFVSKISETIKCTENYQLPINNNEYFGNSDSNLEAKDYGIFDFIIIGAGTAGGVIANRLLEISNFTVLLVEAGKEDPEISKVLGLGPNMILSDSNWGYNFTKNNNSCLGSINQKCLYPRGKGLGGSSSINVGFYARGKAEDYDRWETLGNNGWSYKDSLPYFKKSEKAKFSVDIDRKFHGFDGVQPIDIPEDSILTKELINAFKELGKTEGDYNGYDQYKIGRPQFYLDYNTRASTAHSFIRPILNKSNLNITLESYVSKIHITGNTANGIEFWKRGVKYSARATKEVILCAGAINSPQILMLSGIGPKSELQKFGINPVADLPVGLNMKDHVFHSSLFYRFNNIFYDGDLNENLNRWRLNKRPLTPGFNLEAVTYYNSQNLSDVEVLVIGPTGISPKMGSVLGFNEDYRKSFEVVNETSDIAIFVVLLQPFSTGKVSLQSADPRDFPLIDGNYFSDERDLEALYTVIQQLLKLNTTKSFERIGAKQYMVALPDCDGIYAQFSKEWWFCNLRYTGFAGYHACGTTRMGTNPKESVVNPHLKVHGFRNLRVIDAGVMPTIVRGHTNAAVVMIAEKGADFIKNEHL